MNASNVTHYYVATLLGQYQVDGQVKQRHLNIIFDVETPYVPRATLNAVQQSGVQLLITAAKISPDQLVDMTHFSQSYLGAMTPEQFHGSDQDEESAGRPVPSPLN